MNTATPCRFCGAPLTDTFADLGMSPLSNSYVPLDRARAMEPFYPLHAYACRGCRLVQLEAEKQRLQFEAAMAFNALAQVGRREDRRVERRVLSGLRR